MSEVKLTKKQVEEFLKPGPHEVVLYVGEKQLKEWDKLFEDMCGKPHTNVKKRS